MAAACVRLGGGFQYDSQIEQVEPASKGINVVAALPGTTESERTNYDDVVICAGVSSRSLASQLGDRVNVYPVKGYSITVELENQESQEGAPWVSLLDDDAKIVTSRLGRDRFRIAGTAEFNGENYDIRRDRIKPLTEWCRELFPTVSTNNVIPWAGLRLMMPNMMPRVG